MSGISDNIKNLSASKIPQENDFDCEKSSESSTSNEKDFEISIKEIEEKIEIKVCPNKLKILSQNSSNQTPLKTQGSNQNAQVQVENEEEPKEFVLYYKLNSDLPYGCPTCLENFDDQETLFKHQLEGGQ